MSVLTPALVCAAFWLAIALHARRDPAGTRRFAVSLAVGAAAAHVGFALLFHGGETAVDRGLPGASILFLPLGPLACCRRPGALECLPLPIALARLGCAASGCCLGGSGEPLPLLEGAALAGLHVCLRRLPAAARPGAFLLAFGVLRLAQEPWRPDPPAAIVTPAAVALAWALVGAAGLARSATTR